MKKGLKQIVSILLCCVMLLTNVQITYAVDSETNTTDNNNFVENSTEKSSENSVDVVSGSAIRFPLAKMLQEQQRINAIQADTITGTISAKL